MIERKKESKMQIKNKVCLYLSQAYLIHIIQTFEKII
jgi:hypothetical protein